MTIQQLLQAAKQSLSLVTDSPALEAEVLLAHVMQRSRAYLYAAPEALVPHEIQASFDQLLQRRLQKEPMAYLTGSRAFWTFELSVTKDTLIPRPETELLVERTLALFSEGKRKVAEVGTGSGAIALAIQSERPHWEVVATDVSEQALEVARGNAKRLGLDQVRFVRADWCEALLPASVGMAFDVVMSNPPYIAETEWATYADGLAYEPRSALTSGVDGLDAIRLIVKGAKAYLQPDGYCVIEHGFQQAAAVRALFEQAGYEAIVSLNDYAGHERVTLGKKGKKNPR